MIPRRQCEFYLLRYVPDPVRNEFVHIGVILREAGDGVKAFGAGSGAGNRNGEFALRFTADWRRVRCLDPDADTGMLEGLESELRRRLTTEPEGNLFHVLEDSFSNSIQMTAARAYLAESMPAGVEELMRLYVEPMKKDRQGTRVGGRSAIYALMRSEFERVGVWDLMRKRIEVAKYTRPGDSLRIDMGYQPNGVVRMFHAVSLDPGGMSSSGAAASGLEIAKVLAFSAPRLIAGVERVERAALELTAVVEPSWKAAAPTPRPAARAWQEPWDRELDSELDRKFDEERLAAYRFAVETMEEHRIRVITTSDLSRAAETARRELHV